MTPFVHLRDWQAFEVEPTGSTSGFCECCGTNTSHRWGFIHHASDTVASYFVKWTDNTPNHGAWFDLIIGPWGHGTYPKNRAHIAMEFLSIEGRPNFMVRNSDEAEQNYNSIAQITLSRKDVIGTPFAPHIFALTDAIYMSDELEHVRAWFD